MRIKTLAALVAYVATIPAANLLVEHIGVVPVGFDLLAPAGVYVIGATLILRDVVRELAGKRTAAAAILVGAAVSWAVSAPALALASVAAFLLSETMDAAVYEPLRKRGRTTALVASNAVGLFVDSAVFLWLAFGSFAFLPGQLIGKSWVTVAAILVIAGYRRAVRA